ncbi:MAG TPA: alkyl hydroperoxide reductase subunit F [Tetragenococcus sp.]|nr:alkyl hydroperoxide reductase subunit F [Tetragenococcus sp.]
MALDHEIKSQLAPYLDLLENEIVFQASLADNENSQKVKDFLTEIAAMSAKISIEEKKLPRTPSFMVVQPGKIEGVTFAGLPLGHEFTSFILSLIQVAGRAPKIDDESRRRIEAIDQTLAFETYASLTCHNCPDVVQALNIMTVLNPKISHTMIEGGMFQEEVDKRDVMAVPTVFLNGKEFASGRMNMEQIIDQIAGPAGTEEFDNKGIFDVLVVGGGPSGNSAAIYAARKGIKTGLVAENFGGQVMDTRGIENIIGTPYTEGPLFMESVEGHTHQYDVDIMKDQKAVDIRKKDIIEVELENGAVLKTKAAVLSLGAHWRNVNVSGEEEFRTKGVTNCPHCDGPLFTGKDVAVIGGGNSGIEAAIDLAGLAKHVYVIEFLPELKADQVLQDRVAKLNNMTVITNAATTEITGDKHVNGISYKDRATEKEHHIELEGVFVQIGLMPNTAWLKDTEVELSPRGEIITDERGMTNIEGIFAAGDCTQSPYKQIIIAMGSGATAALGAFDYLIRQ